MATNVKPPFPLRARLPSPSLSRPSSLPRSGCISPGMPLHLTLTRVMIDVYFGWAQSQSGVPSLRCHLDFFVGFPWVKGPEGFLLSWIRGILSVPSGIVVIKDLNHTYLAIPKKKIHTQKQSSHMAVILQDDTHHVPDVWLDLSISC